jgi:hypothetical protein
MVCVIDFDGTFLVNDFFKEAFFKKIIENPFFIIKHFFIEKKGILALKVKLLSDCKVDYPLEILMNHLVINWISENRYLYDKILLVSASPDFFVKSILDKTSFFDEIHGSKDVNLKGISKFNYIKERWGDFDYLGNSNDDLPIFKYCNRAFIVSYKSIVYVSK